MAQGGPPIPWRELLHLRSLDSQWSLACSPCVSFKVKIRGFPLSSLGCTRCVGISLVPELDLSVDCQATRTLSPPFFLLERLCCSEARAFIEAALPATTRSG